MPITRAYASAAQPGNAFLAGKNKIINGDFNINQRGFTSLTSNGFGFDRFGYIYGDGTVTYSAQTFTAGAAPVAGYEAANFARIATASQTAAGAYSILQHKIEDVRTLAGQTSTLSFWAKANSGTPKIAVELEQFFGTGGSPSTTTQNYFGQVTLSTSWVRYSLTFTIPSLSGKTVGTNANTSHLIWNLWTSAGSSFNSRTGSIGIQNSTIDFWGVQLEAGAVATPFTTATGTLAGELAACQRYYWRTTATENATPLANGMNTSTTTGRFFLQFPVQMRIPPTSIDYSALQISDYDAYGTDVTTIAFESPGNGPRGTIITASGGSGFTDNQPSFLRLKTSGTSYFGLNSEL